MTPRIGELCAGYGGLGMAVQSVLGGEMAWCADNDPGASKILAHHWPTVPNHGDLTTTDWATVEPVDIITAGWPCQPWSLAGKGKGAQDERAIWPAVADAVRHLRPRYVVLENVAAVVVLGELARAVGDLANLGYVGSWRCLRASDVGAPHGRNRCFIAATDPDSIGGNGGGLHRSGERWWPQPADGSGGEAIAHAEDKGSEINWGCVTRRPQACETGAGDACGDGGCSSTPDTTGNRRDEGRTESAGQLGRPDVAERGGAATPDADGATGPVTGGIPPGSPQGAASEAFRGTGRGGGASDPDTVGVRRGATGRDDGLRAEGLVAGDIAWGQYEPAIHRWESVLGRCAPAPTELGRTGNPRLSPRFVEWLMGLAAGHVTDVPGLSRNEQLKALGNGVVSQQAAAALRVLLNAEAVAA